MPCMIRWPGKIDAGSRCREMLSSLDMLPLFLRASGEEIPPDVVLDGKDPLPALQGMAKSSHESLFWRYGKYSGLRQGDWKIVRANSTNPWMLFDLAKDIGERTNLASEHPDQLQEMIQHFEGNVAEMQDQ